MPKGIKGFQKGHKHSEETKRKIGKALSNSIVFRCDYCKKEALSKPSHFSRKKRHFCSKECYSRFRSECMRPDEHNSWKGGITKETQRGRGSRKYKDWQNKVKERDGYQCVWCRGSERLEVDHIKRWSTHPELRYEISNGRTLCMKCHNKTRNKKYYQNPELLQANESTSQ